MAKVGKRMVEINKGVNHDKVYGAKEAIELLKGLKDPKFNESFEVHVVLGIEPKKSDQSVQTRISLPHGTGKSVRVGVLCPESMADEAKNAGAARVDSSVLIEEIKAGQINFDVLVATPDMIKSIAPLAKVLGPRGLMPSAKAGTMTPNIAKVVSERVKGQISVKAATRMKEGTRRSLKSAPLSAAIGLKSFTTEQLLENIEEFFNALNSAKPISAKGQFIRQVAFSTTMGPALKVDTSAFAGAK